MNNMKDYHGLYLKVDVLLLVCVFETFRTESINCFDLDPARYLSTLGYEWDAMLRFTDVNLKLMSDIEKYQFIENKIRGDTSMICKGYAEASNKFFKSYDANKLTLYSIYLEQKNSYGHSMIELLPTEILDWFNPKDFNLDNYSIDSPIWHLLEVDLDYPDELHDLHNDYPLADRKLKVKK